jgi:hypothetical protein
LAEELLDEVEETVILSLVERLNQFPLYNSRCAQFLWATRVNANYLKVGFRVPEGVAHEVVPPASDSDSLVHVITWSDESDHYSETNIRLTVDGAEAEAYENPELTKAAIAKSLRTVANALEAQETVNGVYPRQIDVSTLALPTPSLSVVTQLITTEEADDYL